MKVGDFQKAKAIAEDAKGTKNFYDIMISKAQRCKSDHLPRSDIFECGKVMDFIIDYLEVEKKMAMEKAEKMIEEI